MAMNYTSYVASLANLTAYNQSDPSFQAVIPNAIDDAEQRIYRELDLLDTNFLDYSTTLTNGSRKASLNQNFVVVDIINVLTPAGSGDANGTRVPLTPVSREVLNALWPSNSTGQAVPAMYAMLDQWNILVGPSPDGAYALEAIGTQRPAPLSATNPNTFLTDRLPDLFLAASMIFMSAFMRNWGAQASDPQMGLSWEQHYAALKNSAEAEEARKYRWSGSWSSYPISPVAQPQRG